MGNSLITTFEISNELSFELSCHDPAAHFLSDFKRDAVLLFQLLFLYVSSDVSLS